MLKYLVGPIGVMYLGKLVEVGAGERDLRARRRTPTRGDSSTPSRCPIRCSPLRHRGVHISGELPSAITPPSGCRFRTRCPYDQEICAVEEPALQSFGGDHLAACHFPLQRPVAMAAAAASGATPDS